MTDTQKDELRKTVHECLDIIGTDGEIIPFWRLSEDQRQDYERAERVLELILAKIEEAEKRGKQKGYMIIKEHILNQVYQQTVDKQSLIDLLNTLYDAEESNLTDK